MSQSREKLVVSAPLWDQSTFYGRFRHFAWMTNPCNIFHSKEEFINAKVLLEKYKIGNEPLGTTTDQVHISICATINCDVMFILISKGLFILSTGQICYETLQGAL